MQNDNFKALNLSDPLLRAIEHEGYTVPTPIQAAAIPQALAGRDVMATAQTGTGKTAAFSLPMLQLLSERQARSNGNGKRGVRALILTPTRELAVQIDASFRAYGRYLKLRTAVILGGVPMGSQIRALQRDPDIVVATPGRLLDLINQRYLRLDQIEMFVLDEADRMLDMGFIRDVRKIEKMIPRQHQTMLFSATMSREIADLAADLLDNPAHVEVTRSATPVGKVSQKVMFVRQNDKLALLTEILRDKNVGRTLVFTRTKHKADRITRSLTRDGVSADSIHSNKTQGARQRALNGFDRGQIRVLVATDIMARGIDVDNISHVINFELPNDAESYVHRIGRTARAGADGIAYSFCDSEEIKMLRAIERLTRIQLDSDNDHPYHCESTRSLRSGSPVTRRVAGGGGGGSARRFPSRSRRVYR
ncbi:MAG TPA: DEAD/DEAH box helicase [Candidatus Krumholzibacteria bacterium]|nr:DEAD/DEAH box helicase [Candidatus Krumholzibacteria bacterium]